MKRFAFLFAVLLWAHAIHADDPATGSVENDPNVKEIMDLDRKYVDAFNKGDIDMLLSFYANDTVYVTGDGATLNGIEQVRDAFTDEFSESVKPKLKLDVREIKLVADDQAVERGTAVLTTDDKGIVTDYIAEYVKRDGQWKLRRVQERDVPPAAFILGDLGRALVGDWEDTTEGVSVKTSIKWTFDQAFLAREFSSTVGRKLDVEGVEYIGWDAQSDEIRSWYFDSLGGRGNSVWTRLPDGWQVAAVGFLPEGGLACATHFLKIIDHDHLEWKSTNRIIDGNPEPDITVKFTRKTSDSKGTKP
jgi:uncharacterized protein (TIGR02246 family)